MWGITDRGFGIRLLQAARAHGINFFDTADVYGDGDGETILADAFGANPSDVVYATKFGYDFYNHPGLQPGQRERPHDWSPGFVRTALERSLRRLKTDHIALYQLHNPRMDALEDDALWQCLADLKQEGKIGQAMAALGPALRPERQCDEGVHTVKARQAGVHIIYNLLEQQLGRAIFPAAEEAGVPVLIRVPHASDLLTGRIHEDTTFNENDHRFHRVSTDEGKQKWQVQGLKKVAQLGFLTEGTGRTLSQAALQFILRARCVASVLPNIYEEQHLAEYAAAPGTAPLSDEEFERVQALYDADFHLNEEQAA
jgi:aryl-alcohol dehydrogenase-like predicted oxidoreductase